MDELKSRSIRADEVTYEKFKMIAAESFGNQGQCLASLISLYEMEQGKAVITDRKTEIENFQSHMNTLAEMFVSSLQLNQDAEIRVRSNYEALLNSKDMIIADVQDQITNVKSEHKINLDKVNKSVEEVAQLKKSLNTLSEEYNTKQAEWKEILYDKNLLITALEDREFKNKNKITELEEIENKYNDKLEEIERLNRINDEYLNEKIKLGSELKDKNTEISNLKNTHAFEVEMLELRKDKELQQELKLVQDKYFQQLQGMTDKLEQSRLEIRELEKIISEQKEQYNEVSMDNNELKNVITELQLQIKASKDNIDDNKLGE